MECPRRLRECHLQRDGKEVDPALAQWRRRERGFTVWLASEDRGPCGAEVDLERSVIGNGVKTRHTCERDVSRGTALLPSLRLKPGQRLKTVQQSLSSEMYRVAPALTLASRSCMRRRETIRVPARHGSR